MRQRAVDRRYLHRENDPASYDRVRGDDPRLFQQLLGNDRNVQARAVERRSRHQVRIELRLHGRRRERLRFRGYRGVVQSHDDGKRIKRIDEVHSGDLGQPVKRQSVQFRGCAAVGRLVPRIDLHRGEEPELVELPLDVLLVADSEGEHRDKGSDGNENSRDGQKRTELHPPQVADGDQGEVAQGHG